MLIRNEISLKYIVSFNLTFDDPELNKNIDISVGDVVRIAYADMKNRINKRIEGKVSEIKTDRVKNNNFDLARKHKSESQKGKHIGKKNPMYGKTGTLHHSSKAVLCIEMNKIFGSTREVERELFRVNSYLGVMRQADSYAIRREILGMIKPHIFRWCYIKRHFESVILKKRYRREEQIKYRCVRGWDYPLRLPKPIMEGGEGCDDKYISRIENYEPTKFNI